MNIEEKSPVGDHLRELRKRVFRCVFLFLILFSVCLSNSNKILDYVLNSSQGKGFSFAYTYPQEIFLQYISVSLLLAFLGLFPFLILEICLYLSPALKTSERKVLNVGAFFSIILFYLGMAFAAMVVVPFIMQYFSGINLKVEATGMISIEKYLGLVKTMLITFAVVFEMPIFSVMLSVVGILNADRMKKARKIVIVASFVIAAFITPPDVISQCMVALPSIVLYQISIWVCYRVSKRKSSLLNSTI